MSIQPDLSTLGPTADRYPIRLGAHDTFTVVRNLLERASYHERTVAARLGGRGRLAGVNRLSEGRKTLAGPVEDANAAAIRLFLDGEPLAAALTESLFGHMEVESLLQLGLLAPHGDGSLRATVVIAPLRQLWFVSDRIPGPTDDWDVEQDFVYSAINELTAEFISAIPAVPGGRVLELCAGSGVGAIYALALGAAHATATDLTARSVHFASFNAALNGFSDRFTAYESDAWDGVGDERFDLVVAHPPYVPTFSHTYDFRDAGADGESVTRRIFEGVASHLSPGGRVVVRAAVSDRKGITSGERVRGWLGDAAREFDVVQLLRQEFSLIDYYKSINRTKHEFEDLERWMRHFAALEIERFMLCIFDLRRTATDGPPIFERRNLGPDISPAIADWLRSWTRYRRSFGEGADGRMAALAHARPTVPVGTRLAVHLAHAADGWHTVGGNAETAWPVHSLIKSPPFMPTLLELCDGTRGVEALLHDLRGGGLVDERVGVAEMSLMVETLAAAGIIEIAECPLPPHPVD